MDEQTTRAIQHAETALAAAYRDTTPVDLTWIEPAPKHDDWTLAPDALRFLARVVAQVRPLHVLELGSGLSTHIIVRAAAAARITCCVSSIDHDPRFATSPPLPTGARIVVHSQITPLVTVDCGEKLLPQYLIDKSRLASRSPVDLVLIDGPPEVLGGREGTLYQAIDLARPGTLVLVDDAGRATEMAALANWESVLEGSIRVHRLPDFVKGMAAIVVQKAVTMDSLWERRLQSARSTLDRHVAKDERYVLADFDHADPRWTADTRSVAPVTRDEISWGVPENDTAALDEIARWRLLGISAFVVPWTAFWWRGCYPKFFAYLSTTFECVADNDCVLIYRMDVSKNRQVARTSTQPAGKANLART